MGKIAAEEWEPLSIAVSSCPSIFFLSEITYSAENSNKANQNRNQERKGNHNRRVFRVRPESMSDLVLRSEPSLIPKLLLLLLLKRSAARFVDLRSNGADGSKEGRCLAEGSEDEREG